MNMQNKNKNQSKGRNMTPCENLDSRRQPRVPRFDKYTSMNGSTENIYLDTRDLEQYMKPALRESTECQRKFKNSVDFMRPTVTTQTNADTFEL